MTRMEMREWVNDQIKTGQMTLDESTPFVGMTIGAENNHARTDFIQKIRDGIGGAVWRGDTDGQARLEIALAIVERYQGRGISVFA